MGLIAQMIGEQRRVDRPGLMAEALERPARRSNCRHGHRRRAIETKGSASIDGGDFATAGRLHYSRARFRCMEA